MKFIIVGEKAKGVVGLFDVANGGVALATAYTVRQLIDMGHDVVGVDTLKPFKYTICTRKGEPSKRAENLDALETKKSAVSFVKGIKPSRQEKSANKAKAKKRVASMRQAKAEAKKAEETFKKFLVPFKPSKLLMLETEYELESSEYHDESSSTTYRFLIKSASAMTAFRKIIKDNIPWSIVEDDMKNIMKRFKRYSRVTVEATFRGIPDVWEDKKVIKGISSSYKLDFTNNYEDFGGIILLGRNKSYNISKLDDIQYKMIGSSCRHIDVENFRIGATADNYALSDFIKGLGRRRVVVDENNNIMDINNCDYYIGSFCF